jgi:hypothetical protein
MTEAALLCYSMAPRDVTFQDEVHPYFQWVKHLCMKMCNVVLSQSVVWDANCLVDDGTLYCKFTDNSDVCGRPGGAYEFVYVKAFSQDM